MGTSSQTGSHNSSTKVHKYTNAKLLFTMSSCSITLALKLKLVVNSDCPSPCHYFRKISLPPKNFKNVVRLKFALHAQTYRYAHTKLLSNMSQLNLHSSQTPHFLKMFLFYEMFLSINLGTPSCFLRRCYFLKRATLFKICRTRTRVKVKVFTSPTAHRHKIILKSVLTILKHPYSETEI